MEKNNFLKKLIAAKYPSAAVQSDNGIVKITVSKPKEEICPECGKPFLRPRDKFVVGRGACEEDAWQDAASVLGIKDM